MNYELPRGRVLALDPGNEKTGVVYYDTNVNGSVIAGVIADNRSIEQTMWKVTTDRMALSSFFPRHLGIVEAPIMVIEHIGHYGTGMPAGREVFDTCVAIGRFAATWEITAGMKTHLMQRKDVKLQLCRSSRAKDANVNQAVWDRFGGDRKSAVGTKKNPGPCYGFVSHMWSALALAIAFLERQTEPAPARGEEDAG